MADKKDWLMIRKTIDSCVNDSVDRIMPLCTETDNKEVYQLVRNYVYGIAAELAHDVESTINGDLELEDED